jgi:RecA-family ATPase
VLFISLEDSAEMIRLRADAHYADARRLSMMCILKRTSDDGTEHEIMFSLLHIDALEKVLQTMVDCRAIIIDPIGSVLGGDTDAHRDNEVRSVLAPLAKLAEKYNVAALVVAHRRKSSSSHADDLALGSRAFTGIARVVWHLSRDPQNKNRRLLLPGKNNLAPEGDGLAFSIAGEPAAIRWEHDPVRMSADEALAAEQTDHQHGHEPEAKNQAIEWLSEFLASGPKATKDVKAEAKAAGFAWRTIWRAKSSLSIRTYRDGYGEHGCWWWQFKSSNNQSVPKDAAKCANAPNIGTLGTLGTDWNNNVKNEAPALFLTREASKDAKCAKLSPLGEGVARIGAEVIP